MIMSIVTTAQALALTSRRTSSTGHALLQRLGALAALDALTAFGLVQTELGTLGKLA